MNLINGSKIIDCQWMDSWWALGWKLVGDVFSGSKRCMGHLIQEILFEMIWIK